ncbi:MAG TPA: tripartite tricarboxylate transporter substrate binding protein [Pusillimonas sp.]|uniref:Bug family tripartite tricarboxylate transporter substrate binding protein n=1 Tax=Pusillimonas sp. TaxID=3040095 RepID=UPI002BF3B7F4|nr:tripartite tricarboxylate transporter substrate binding protein [Pusillimonas sp.]HUH88130.1 tripartite tricarboxylate transporter substrate binding protein [Pusillimonas sp.]
MKLVVPFPPGGSSDIPARLIAQKLEQVWGKPVVVENRAGATGTIGEGYVARAKPDGHTLLVGTSSSHTMGPYTIKDRPYDPLTDLRGVTLFAWVPHLIVVHTSVDAESVSELIHLAKAKPGELNYATSGHGSSVHLATEIFSRKAGIGMVQIPYRGVNPAAMAVASGQTQLMFPPAVVALPLIEGGALRPLAILAANPLPSLPQTPSTNEAGLEGYEFSTWVGLLAPADTPDDIANKIAADVAHIMKDVQVRRTLEEMSFTPTTTSPQEFDDIIRRETAEHKTLIEELGL